MGWKFVPIGIIILIAFFQNCAPGFQSANLSSGLEEVFRSPTPLPSPPPGPTPTPTPTPSPTPLESWIQDLKPNLVNDCMTNANYDSCIFYESPVAQAQTPLNISYGTSNLANHQIHGIKIEPNLISLIGGKRVLQTSTFTNITSNPPEFPAVGQTFKKTYGTDASSHHIGQIQSFYWATRAENYFKNRAGKYYSSGHGIQLNLFATNQVRNSYFYYTGLNLEIGVSAAGSAGFEYALDANVVVHELGHGEQYIASGRTDGFLPDNNSVDCGFGDGHLCCASANGCREALSESISDIYTLFIFPRNPAMYETSANSVDGWLGSYCPNNTIRRDPRLNLTGAQIFAQCPEIHILGLAYFRIWYLVRSAVANNDASLKKLETLFIEHIKTLDSNDTFTSAYTKIKSLDQTLFASQFTALFKNAYSQVGYTVN